MKTAVKKSRAPLPPVRVESTRRTAAEYLAQGDNEWVQMSCGVCGGNAGWSRWCATPVFGDLPPGEFQCPKCGHAFRRQRYDGNPWRDIDGQFVYRPVDLVPIPTRL